MILVAGGGCGSSYVMRRAMRKYGNKAHVRVDVEFKPAFWPDSSSVYQLDNYNGWDHPPDDGMVGIFRRRTNGFVMNQFASLRDNLEYYIKQLTDSNCVMFCMPSCNYNLFSFGGFKDIYFLVRHPVHQMISWVGRHRGHGKEFHDACGFWADELEGVRYWILCWNAFVSEYENLKRENCTPHLIRFEEGYKNELFNGWDGTKRNNLENISDKMIDYIKDRSLWNVVYNNFEEYL